MYIFMIHIININSYLNFYNNIITVEEALIIL